MLSANTYVANGLEDGLSHTHGSQAQVLDVQQSTDNYIQNLSVSAKFYGEQIESGVIITSIHRS